jgi:hypothetical protein
MLERVFFVILETINLPKGRRSKEQDPRGNGDSMNTEKNSSPRDQIIAQAAAFLYRPPFVINPGKDEPPSPEGALFSRMAECLYVNAGPEVATSIRPNKATGSAVKRAITSTLCTELRGRGLDQYTLQSLRIRNIVASGFTVDPTIGFCEDVTTYRYDSQMTLYMSSRFWQGVVAGLFEGLVCKWSHPHRIQ